jgi:hypothetical protein
LPTFNEIKLKIAYLIMAHGNFVHLQRLINALNDGSSMCFIHVDKKAKLPQLTGNNFIFIKKRFNVYWASFSEVEVTLELLRESVKGNYGRYVLLSGADYPVKSQAEIYKRLSNDDEFITTGLWGHPMHSKSCYIYYYNNYFNRRSNSLSKKFWVWAENNFRKTRIKRKIPFDIYSGMQWFIFTHKAVADILKVVESNNKYITYFKHGRAQSESFFHTVIGNEHLFDNRIKAYLTFVAFDPVAGPEIIRQKHFEELKNGDYLFARKFDDRSDEILSMIDKILRVNEKPAINEN